MNDFEWSLTRNKKLVGMLALWIAATLVSYFALGLAAAYLTIFILILGTFTLFQAIYYTQTHTQSVTQAEATSITQATQLPVKANDNIRNKPEMFDALFNYSHIGIGIFNLDGHFIKVNQALCQIFGYSDQSLLSTNYYQLIHPDDCANLQSQIQMLVEDKIKVYQSEHECFRKNSESIWVKANVMLVRDETNHPAYYVVQVQNITLQKKAEERLRHMAYHDPLTGLANRNKLEQFISQILAQSRRHQESFAILFIDLDRFKNINDTIGHEAGDILLQIIADRLKGAIRNTDLVARLGGDEFVIIVTDVTKSEAVAIIANKILDSVMQAVVVKGQELYITTSIGISLYPFDGQNMQTLMKNADLALYRAKDFGKNNYQFYTSEMTSKAQEKLFVYNHKG